MISIQWLPFTIQIVSFLLLTIALKRLLFDPFTQVLVEREKRTSGVRADAGAIQHQIQASASDYDRRILEVRRTLATELEAGRVRTAAEQREIVAAAQSEAGTMLETERQTLQAQVASARAALDARAGELATMMLERVGGRKFS